MAGKTPFKSPTVEERALHDSWSEVGRVLFGAILLSAGIWLMVSGLRWLVHHGSEGLLHWVEHEGSVRAWAALFGALAVGGLARAWLMTHAAWQPTRGDGVDVALANYHVTYEHEGDDPQPRYRREGFRLALRKAIATLLTLAPGGSGGLEAPVVMMGEASAAGFAKRLRVMSEHELRTYQLAGISAAVSTLLNAPFASALFALEIAYQDRIIYRKFVYALMAGLVTHVLNVQFLDATAMFSAPPHGRTFSMLEYGLAALVAVAVSAPVALGFGLVMQRLQWLVSRTHPMLHGVIGAWSAAAIALLLWWSVGMSPMHVLGMGEHTLIELLHEIHFPWWFLMLAVLGKMWTTGLTIQSGGSAGILIPAMFLGGVSGGVFGELLHVVGLDMGGSIFVIVGIASALVAVIGVPFAAVALVYEVFGPNYGPPAILACGLTYVLTMRLRVYQNQRRSPDPEADETGGN